MLEIKVTNGCTKIPISGISVKFSSYHIKQVKNVSIFKRFLSYYRAIMSEYMYVHVLSF